MIAVLAAMLFIGIVTASMVKNTKSQSTASVGYGTMQIMSSTVRSGMIATETYFLTGDSAHTLALITKSLNAGKDSPDKKPFLLFNNNSKDGKKTQLGNSGQYFRSQLLDVKKKNDETAYGYFEIQSGRRESGKGLKKAMAFYEMGNVNIKWKSSFFGSNAFFAGENGKFEHGNAGTRIVGNATYETGLKTQNGAPVEFVKDDKGEGSVYIKDYLEILNDKNVTFDVNVFVDGWTDIKSQVPNQDIFKKDAGFNGNIIAPSSKIIGFGGNVWFNGDYMAPASNPYSAPYPYETILKANGTNNRFYYTDKIPMKTDAVCHMCPESGPCSGATCCPHSCSHSYTGFASAHIKDFVNMTKDEFKWGSKIPTDVILDALKMDPLEERREPNLALDESHIGKDKKFLSFTKSQPDGYGKNYLDGDELNAFYNNTVNDPAYSKYYTDDGHLLLHVDGSVRTEGGTFNEKVILKVEGSGAQIDESGKFYNSGPNASTLVYVGKNGILNNFGCGDNGNFRGLVYVDPENDETITFKWGQNSSIDGAVLLKGGRLTWNANGAAVTTIRRDKEVLNNFGFLVKDDSNKNEREATLVNPGGIKLTPLGYYFY